MPNLQSKRNLLTSTDLPTKKTVPGISQTTTKQTNKRKIDCRAATKGGQDRKKEGIARQVEEEKFARQRAINKPEAKETLREIYVYSINNRHLP